MSPAVVVSSIGKVAVQVQADRGPDLLVHWRGEADSRTFARAGIGSLLVHVVLLTFILFLLSLPPPAVREGPQITVDVRHAVHLVAPRLQEKTPELTQRAPNPGKVAKELTVEGLLARPAVVPTPPQPKTFKAPPVPAPVQAKPGPILPEPKIQAEVRPPAALPPTLGNPQVPPPPKPQPQIQTQEPPKLAFENPGQGGVAPPRPGALRIPTPKTSVEDAIHEVARGGGEGGLTVGDSDEMPSIPETLRQQTPRPGRVQSSLQLLSDPKGVDFKPYLIRILAMVRRNWLAIIPESARMGRRGRVLLQFIVAHDGSVPKLVIAMPSGAEALDRAAVAGVSASVPFPALPAEFKGSEIRLQFAFSYNMQ